MKRKWLIIIPALIICFIAVMSIVGNSMLNNNNNFKFKENIYINGQEMKGYSTEKAYQVVKDKLKTQMEDTTIELKYNNNVWKFNEDDMFVEDAVKSVVQKAYATSIEQRKTANAINGNNGNFKISFKSVFKNLDENINEIIKTINKEPVNSEVVFTPDSTPMFTITKSENGIEVDEQKLYDCLENQFLKTKNIYIDIPVNEIKPEKDENYYSDKLFKMSEFSTDLTNSQAGRRHNVKYALAKFNGKVVKAGETVSFNEVTSPQTLEGGYKNATVILNGVFTQGVGGGICQASTTLYNACVLANLEINEVHKHSLPVGYVELSLDAMVSDGYADFIFTNTSEFDIYIKTYVKGDRAYAEIYGKSIPDGYKITRDAEFVGNIPHRGDKIVPDTDKQYTNKVIYKGEYYRLKYPREGYEAKGFKNTYKGDELIKREEIRHEKYQPIDGIIIEGTEELPEGFVLPESDVEIIKPETVETTSSKKISQKIKQQNPTRFALNIYA